MNNLAISVSSGSDLSVCSWTLSMYGTGLHTSSLPDQIETPTNIAKFAGNPASYD